MPTAERTLVVDVTYRCNSPCLYCRWGDDERTRREPLPTADTLLAPEVVRRLGITRVVLSGGEPLLHPELAKILAHYRDCTKDRVVITNGLLLTGAMCQAVATAGATGFTFSIDAVDPVVYGATRGLTALALRTVLHNLATAAQLRESLSFELGINSVVTSANARWPIVEELLSVARRLSVDFVRFQPVFNDGYAGAHAPALMLGPTDAERLDGIAEQLAVTSSSWTNPPGFWHDLAALARGEQLPGRSCGLGTSALLVRGRLARCYWVPEADVVLPDVEGSTRTLSNAKSACPVDGRCFCMQRLDHVWRT